MLAVTLALVGLVSLVVWASRRQQCPRPSYFTDERPTEAEWRQAERLALQQPELRRRVADHAGCSLGNVRLQWTGGAEVEDESDVESLGLFSRTGELVIDVAE